MNPRLEHRDWRRDHISQEGNAERALSNFAICLFHSWKIYFNDSLSFGHSFYIPDISTLNLTLLDHSLPDLKMNHDLSNSWNPTLPQTTFWHVPLLDSCIRSKLVPLSQCCLAVVQGLHWMHPLAPLPIWHMRSWVVVGNKSGRLRLCFEWLWNTQKILPRYTGGDFLQRCIALKPLAGDRMGR